MLIEGPPGPPGPAVSYLHFIYLFFTCISYNIQPMSSSEFYEQQMA